MRIEFATMTGPNDLTNVDDLVKISNDFPFVEWGVLVSRSQTGGTRYPTHEWIKSFLRVDNWRFNTSVHICGQWVRDICKGAWSLPSGIWWSRFKRMQLNTHGSKHKFEPAAFGLLENLKITHPIFQVDGENDEVIPKLTEYGFHPNVIFDRSHGAGVLPAEWPKPIKHVHCTYAGGLGPDNLKDELKKIEQVVFDAVICIDMETRIRSDDDKIFDLKKVVRALKIAEKYL